MIALLLLSAVLSQPLTLSGVVVDASGASVSAARVTVTVGGTATTVTTAEDGKWSVPIPGTAETLTLRVAAPGFAPVERSVHLPSPLLRTELRPQGIAEQITVSGDSSPARLAIESSVTTIDRSSIAAAPEVRLDDQLR